jgi:hypothetical protein
LLPGYQFFPTWTSLEILKDPLAKGDLRELKREKNKRVPEKRASILDV